MAQRKRVIVIINPGLDGEVIAEQQGVHGRKCVREAAFNMEAELGKAVADGKTKEYYRPGEDQNVIITGKH